MANEVHVDGHVEVPQLQVQLRQVAGLINPEARVSYLFSKKLTNSDIRGGLVLVADAFAYYEELPQAMRTRINGGGGLEVTLWTQNHDEDNCKVSLVKIKNKSTLRLKLKGWDLIAMRNHFVEDSHIDCWAVLETVNDQEILSLAIERGTTQPRHQWDFANPMIYLTRRKLTAKEQDEGLVVFRGTDFNIVSNTLKRRFIQGDMISFRTPAEEDPVDMLIKSNNTFDEHRLTANDHWSYLLEQTEVEEGNWVDYWIVFNPQANNLTLVMEKAS